MGLFTPVPHLAISGASSVCTVLSSVFRFCLFVCLLLTNTWKYSGFTPDSVLTITPGGTWDHIGCWGLNFGRPFARQAPYSLHHHSSPQCFRFLRLLGAVSPITQNTHDFHFTSAGSVTGFWLMGVYIMLKGESGERGEHFFS